MSQTLRSRKGIGAGAAIALCLAAMSAAAQDRPVTTGRPDTVKLKVSGHVNMDYVQRDAALRSVPSMTLTGGSGNNVNSGNTVEGEITIRFDAELTEKISAVVEIGRLRTNDTFGVQPFLGDNNAIFGDISLRDAHLKVADFLSQGLVAKMGIIDWSFDVRGRGHALAFNPHWSQPMSRNYFAGQDTTDRLEDAHGITTATELEPIGLHLAWTGGQLTVELVALPVVTEAGSANLDEALYAIDAWYSLEQQVGKGSRLGLILAMSNLGPTLGTGSDTRVITFGGGVNLAFQGGIDIYAEGYVQRGAASRENDTSADYDANGHALQVGGRWTAGGESRMWLEVNFTLYSGDDEDGAAPDEVNSFMSYESVNDFLIVEDMYFGLDIDTNYTAIKIMGGTAFGVAGGKDNLELQVGVGFFTMTEDVVLSNSGVAGDEEDKLGTEIDVKTKYHLSKQASINLNFGILTGSDVLEDLGGGPGADSADDSAWLASLGFDVRY